MLEFYIRPWYQKIFVDVVAKQVVKTSPNVITFLSLLFGLLVPILLYFSLSGFAVVALLLSGYCDSLDGTVARLTGATSDIGAVFDIVCDRAVEFAVIFGLYLVNPGSRALLSILMLGSVLLCVTSFLVVGIFVDNNTNKGFFYSRGLMERFEAFVFFVAMILLPAWFGVLSSLLIILVLFTAIMRIYDFVSFAVPNEDETILN